MEKIPPIKKESGVNRIVGFDSEKEPQILEFFERTFKANQLVNKEKEKTPELIELISRINIEMREFLIQYGIETIDIPENNIHIIDRSLFTDDEFEKICKKNNTVSGFFSSLKQAILILRDYDANKIYFLHTLVHEMLHLQGFYSYQKSSKEDSELSLVNRDDKVYMNARRSGFSIGTRDGGKLLFNDLNEAVITELAIRFEKKYLQNYPELESEFNSEREFGSYIDARIQFNDLVDELYERNKKDFDSREQVFSLFAEATMTGRLLTVARLIEKTLGKGMFRIIGERSADKSDNKISL